ncbi:MAG: DMT family transporter [Verrucomicrobiales bacterium]|nr:DMT family transporter [Verrucomicrobiales bacterium]
MTDLTGLFMPMKTPSLESVQSANPRRGTVIMLWSVAAFTANTLLLRYLSGTAHGITPDVPLLFRAVVGIFIVLVFFRGRRPTQIRPVFVNRLLILRGMTGLLGTAAYYWTVPALGAGMATLICNTYVIFASVIAVLALGEKLTPRRFVWLATAFVGIVFLVGPNTDVEGFQIGVYEVIALAGAVLAAASVVLVRKLVVDYSIGTIYLAQCVWIFLPLLVMAAPKIGALTGSEWALLTLAATAAGSGQLAMNEGYRCLSVSAGASIQMLWPVMTTMGGFLLFEESFVMWQLMGAVLILASVWRVSAKR